MGAGDRQIIPKRDVFVLSQVDKGNPSHDTAEFVNELRNRHAGLRFGLRHAFIKICGTGQQKYVCTG